MKVAVPCRETDSPAATPWRRLDEKTGVTGVRPSVSDSPEDRSLSDA